MATLVYRANGRTDGRTARSLSACPGQKTQPDRPTDQAALETGGLASWWLPSLPGERCGKNREREGERERERAGPHIYTRTYILSNALFANRMARPPRS